MEVLVAQCQILRDGREGSLPPHPHSYSVLMGTQVKGIASQTQGECISAIIIWKDEYEKVRQVYTPRVWKVNYFNIKKKCSVVHIAQTDIHKLIWNHILLLCDV